MTETDKINILKEGCGFMARVWMRTYAPVSHEETVFVDGEWVKVTIDYDATRGGRKPARRKGDGDANVVSGKHSGWAAPGLKSLEDLASEYE